MKRFAIATLFVVSAFAQNPGQKPAAQIIYGPTLPATCNPALGQVYYKTTATVGAYQCLTANTWTAMAGGGGSTSPASPSLSLQFDNAGAFGGYSSVQPTSLSTPSVPTVVAACPSGPCATPWEYSVLAFSQIGWAPTSGPSVAVNNNATLDGTHSNAVHTSAVAGSQFCVIYSDMGGLSGVPLQPVAQVACGASFTDIGPIQTPPEEGFCCDVARNSVDHSKGIYSPDVGRFDKGIWSDPAGAIPYLFDNDSRVNLFVSTLGEFNFTIAAGSASTAVDDGLTGAVWQANAFNSANPGKQYSLGQLNITGTLPDSGAPTFGGISMYDSVDDLILLSLCKDSMTLGDNGGNGCSGVSGEIQIGASATAKNKTTLLAGTGSGADVALTEDNGNWAITHGGTPSFAGLKTTGAATGKKVVCVDTATGQLYASSTGTDCSN